MDFNDNYPQYEFHAAHSEEDGKGVRKKLWKVFWIMLVITIIELSFGIFQDKLHLTGTMLLKFIYIFFTIAKAAYIVYIFMHLGDENHLLRKVILWPYISFALYLVYMCTITEGNFNRDNKQYLDQHLVDQKNEMRAKAKLRAEGKLIESEHHDGGEHK